MHPDRWARVSRLFAAITERPDSARPATLDDLCTGEEPEVRREVERLLRADRERASILRQPLAELGAMLETERIAPPAPVRTGPYRLLRPIGRGAMSEVFLAIRDDDAYRRQVAVKLIRPGIETDSILRRFLAERQILASLDHPNIARLYDGGVADDGRPYLVMEYVDGLPITDYCDRHRLGIGERLHLYLEVCSAVQHAHQSLLVHRDLKPGNILVTPSGTPKLLDFGIAKPLAPREGVDLRTTQVGHRPMTPGYASPEQVRGDAITTASDVYSLGVLLFELLTGLRPYRLEGDLPHELERAICEQEVAPPSHAIGRAFDDGDPSIEGVAHRRSSTAAELGRRLSGDLDTIVCQALRKSPAERYYSARQLGGDVERHLADLPIVARQDHFGYRLLKFTRRNRSALAAASLGLVLLVGLVAVVDRQASVIEQTRSRAERVSDLLLERLAAVKPSDSEAGWNVPREALDVSLSQIGGRSMDEPDALAERLEAFGDVYRQAGLAEDARWLFEESLDFRRRAGRVDDLAVAGGLHGLGALLVGTGEAARGERLLRDALEIRRRAAGPSWALAESLETLGRHVWQNGSLAEAERLLVESLEVRLEVCPSSAWTARGASDLAQLMLEQQRYEEAAPLQARAAQIRSRLSPKHFDAVRTLEDRALLHFALGEARTAEELFRRAVAKRRSQAGSLHEALSGALVWQGRALIALGRHGEAVEALREALAVRRRLQLGQGAAQANLLTHLGYALAGDGASEAGEAMLRSVMEGESDRLSPHHPRVALIRTLLAGVLHEQGEIVAAGALYRRAADDLASHPEWEFGAGAEPRLALARLLLEQGDPSTAAVEARRALESLHRRHPPGHWRVARAETLLAGALALSDSGAKPRAMLSSRPLR